LRLEGVLSGPAPVKRRKEGYMAVSFTPQVNGLDPKREGKRKGGGIGFIVCCLGRKGIGRD